MIRRYTITIDVTGSNGSASGTGRTEVPVNGRLGAVKIDFTTQASTADTVIVDELGQSILSLTNVNADGWWYPHPEIHDSTGSLINKHTCPFIISGYLSASVSQSNAGTVEITFLICEGG